MTIICSARERAELERRKKQKDDLRLSLITALLIALAIIGFGIAYDYLSPTPAEQAQAEREQKASVYLYQSQQAVARQLKDPYSAKFEVSSYRERNGQMIACGSVNAKNSFGGYAGSQRYITQGQLLRVILDDESSRFRELWLKLCE